MNPFNKHMLRYAQSRMIATATSGLNRNKPFSSSSSFHKFPQHTQKPFQIQQRFETGIVQPAGQSYNPYATNSNVVNAAHIGGGAQPINTVINPATGQAFVSTAMSPIPTATSNPTSTSAASIATSKKQSWFRTNPWFFPYFLTTLPMAAFLIYQQMIINEVVVHTKALEDAVEQFSSIMEYHHSLLGEIIDFPDELDENGNPIPNMDKNLGPDSGPNPGPGGFGRGGPNDRNQAPPPGRWNGADEPRGAPGGMAPPQPPQQQPEGSGYQPRSPAFAAATGRGPPPGSQNGPRNQYY